VGQPPGLATIRQRVSFVRYQDLIVTTDGPTATSGTVRLRREGMAIGTGGIAKGYALDRVGEIFLAAGIENFMMYAGGQVSVHGHRGDRGWRVGIQHPRRGQEYFAFLETEGGSVSTSGDYEHYFRDDTGRYWHHILDPATGEPARRSVSVTILAPTGLYADALSTAVFVLGPERGLAMLAALPFTAEAVILDSECRLHATPGTLDHLVFRIAPVDGMLPGCCPNAPTSSTPPWRGAS
jgi:thiamine biosynthesis lipoprotein